MVRSIAFALGFLGALSFTAAGAFAQLDPDDMGLGTKLGMQEENNSGQVGTVMLFQRGSRTLVDVRVVDEPRGRREPAHIHRGKDCDSLDPKPAFGLAPVVNGHSRTLVDYPQSRLLSGNYVVNVHSASNLAVYVSCGQLYR
jgi:hypothetical protein